MKKNGFTLIELLAVIVILSIIAVITIPMIMNVIDKSKLGALEDSAYGLVESTNLYYSSNIQNGIETIEFTCGENGCVNGDKKLPYKGTIKSGKVKLYSDGKISVCIENETSAAIKKANDINVTISKNGNCNTTGDEYSIDEMISLNSYNELQNQYELLNNELINLKSIGDATTADITLGKTAVVQGETITGTKGTTKFYLKQFQSYSKSDASSTGPGSYLLIDKETNTNWSTLTVGSIVGNCGNYGKTYIYLDNAQIYYRAASTSTASNLQFNVSNGSQVKIQIYTDATCYVTMNNIRIS